MTWPTTQTTNSLDADTDTLQNARPEVKGLADKFNQLVAHVTTFMQGLLTSADAAAARATLDVPARNGANASGTWGISVTGSAATATTAANVTRNVTTSGLATGGGALTGDIAIAVPKATQAQNEAGTNDAAAVTSLGVRQALRATGSAPVFAARAWVNFNGIGTVAIRASGNVSSVTDNGVGDYTINFTTALPDADYAVVAACTSHTGPNYLTGVCTSLSGTPFTKTTTQQQVKLVAGNGVQLDSVDIQVAIFR